MARPPLPPVPPGPDEITSQWLTDALRSTGAIRDAAVTSIRVNSVEAAGLIGRIAKLRPTYDPPNSSSPESIIAKFHAADPVWRRRVAELNRSEVGFYQDIAGLATLRTPSCFYSSIEASTGECVILLEDLYPARTVNTLEGAGIADTRLVVETMARFHARWWSHPALTAFGWLLPLPESPIADYVGAVIEKIDEKMATDITPLIVSLRLNFRGALAMSAREPATVVHNDLAAKNAFFDTRTGDALALFDFQVVARARGPIDIAHFMGSSVTTENRRISETEILHLYHAKL